MLICFLFYEWLTFQRYAIGINWSYIRHAMTIRFSKKKNEKNHHPKKNSHWLICCYHLHSFFWSSHLHRKSPTTNFTSSASSEAPWGVVVLPSKWRTWWRPTAYSQHRASHWRWRGGETPYQRWRGWKGLGKWSSPFWLALSREWGNESPIYPCKGWFPHSLLRASQHSPIPLGLGRNNQFVFLFVFFVFFGGLW